MGYYFMSLNSKKSFIQIRKIRMQMSGDQKFLIPFKHALAEQNNLHHAFCLFSFLLIFLYFFAGGGDLSMLSSSGAGYGSVKGQTQTSTTFSGISGLAGDKTVRSDYSGNPLVNTFNANQIKQDLKAQV